MPRFVYLLESEHVWSWLCMSCVRVRVRVRVRVCMCFGLCFCLCLTQVMQRFMRDRYLEEQEGTLHLRVHTSEDARQREGERLQERKRGGKKTESEKEREGRRQQRSKLESRPRLKRASRCQPDTVLWASDHHTTAPARALPPPEN
jgi:hypothetical protein